MGAIGVLGVGSLVILGALVYVGAKAVAEDAGAVDHPLVDPASSSKVTDLAPPPDEPAETADTEPDEEPTPSAPSAVKPGVTAGGKAQPSTSPQAAGGAGSGKFFCNATGWVRVCGFANVCNNQMVSGSGLGSDRMSASMMAKNACENMMRAKGGFGVCTVACSPTK